ncbi:DEAD/DEAH box helicase [Marispirochaeta sp.]|uniref:DEAD/DEAH box helicase n=1 Tax=Marispirochaeta sp. TaxID=2038653 RepID=UPI0029C6C46F|nr:DEAD/DEAH box helicase [Marispirochaeta sp.]
MVSTLSKDEVLSGFPPDYFDYIVIDEFHHAGAVTYQKVLDHFSPQFLLGLTATPERMDGRDILQLCDYNIAHEIRLFDAIENELLVPFYYFAIYDEADYSTIRWSGTSYNTDDLERLLTSDTRAQLVLNNLRKFLPPGEVKSKALGFCVNTGHALFMRERFEALGSPSAVVLGTTPEDERNRIISRLINEDDPLEIIFSVDVFTEGVDIPELTHILLLRPTESFTVFQQQIGRGLRRHNGKDFVVILDFIGNYRSSFIPYLSLRGISSARKIDLSDLPEMPKVPSICYVDKTGRLRKSSVENCARSLGQKQTIIWKFTGRYAGKSTSPSI